MADERTVSPVGQNDPRNYYTTNPLGSDFAAAQGLTTTFGLTPSLDPRIIQIIPKQFAAFKFYSAAAKMNDMTGKELNWLMAQYPNRPAQVKTATIAVAPGGVGVSVPQTIPIEDISIPGLAKGLNVIYPDGTQGTITAVSRTPGAASITVASFFGLGLSAVAVGDLMPLHSNAAADGTYGYDNFYTSDTVRYSNIIEMTYEACRYDRAQYEQVMRQQMVPFVDQQRKEMVYRFGAANEARLWLGNYGYGPMGLESFFNNGTANRATHSRGILQSMAADGVITQNTTAATCVADIKQGMMDASLLANTDKFLVFGISDNLEAMAVAERSTRTRYAPGDTTVSTDVIEYKFANGLSFTPVAVNAWKDTSYYGTIMRNKIIVIPDGGEDVGVSIRYQQGVPFMEHTTHSNINDGMAQYVVEVMRGQWCPQVKKAFTFKAYQF